jgi:hypothetical protein
MLPYLMMSVIHINKNKSCNLAGVGFSCNVYF